MQKFMKGPAAARIIQSMGKEFAVVKNPDYVHPPYDIYPMAPKLTQPLKEIVAVVMDMDGTTTTTEALCIHSLEYMVRQITNRMSAAKWKGLDPVKDYPHIIGNSTTKHVEYLIEKYQSHIKMDQLQKAYLEAVAWTLMFGKDRKRREEVATNLHHFGLRNLPEDERFRKMLSEEKVESADFIGMTEYLVSEYSGAIKPRTVSDIVRLGIDIYYHRYHEILNVILSGHGDVLSQDLLGKPEIRQKSVAGQARLEGIAGQARLEGIAGQARLIEPMKGVAIFLALIKGWLGNEAEKLLPILLEEAKELDPEFKKQLSRYTGQNRLAQLGSYFQKHPARAAVVTSSIYFEANVVLTEVFRILQDQVKNWPLPPDKRDRIMAAFSSYDKYYDAVISASDSSEIRLKPHRDLYSIALHRLGIPKEQFGNVIGFEDSESGTIAIRSAGIGMCIALPFSETQHHDFSAASYIVKGALPETLLRYYLFLDTGKE